MTKTILVAGATGNLGLRIVKALLKNGARVRAIVRASTDAEKVKNLEKLGVTVYGIDLVDANEVSKACMGVDCVVSALAGLRATIIDAQKILLDAAVVAKVPRFIPSDYALDFTKFKDGENRNLDLRREFHIYLDKAAIAATTIFNGAFADMLTNEMPLILFKQKWILYWGNANHKMGFTTIDNTAEYTALAAMDTTTPRFLHIAGDQLSPREMKVLVSEVTGKKFTLFRAGGKILLSFIIKIARTLAPGKQELYPAWQGMQYMCNMIDERANLDIVDKNRYASMQWTTVRDLLTKFVAENATIEKNK
jgi:nucleoside-diphosphate-sugar epimerase